MDTAFRHTLQFHHRVVILGTDSPTLPPRYVEAAFDALKTHPVVISPAEDGGYVLLGMSERVYPVFSDDIPWGHSTVLEKTLEALSALSLNYHLLPPWYDVDHPEDVTRLHLELKDLRDRGEVYPRRTLEVLETLNLEAI